MGAVYLARQVSLDRQVAVKVMNPEWSRNPVFLSRFTREAYAAAQLVHHNVVQIYDIGEAHDMSFFSMEFVEGTSVGDLVKDKGKLGAEESVGYILQAARGLKFAHDRGMIHRDIKPDNLMLNTEGIVKVADLGLVKTPESDEAQRAIEAPDEAPSTRAREMSGVNVTNINQAMGTPAYMPPEQAQNAAGVDHRADIYSLGCTLYVMVTGRPVFEGNTAMEVMTKHQTEPIVRPEAVANRVPSTLGDIVVKMIAKNPDERYQSTSELIAALQDYLGLDTTGPFTPREEHAVGLEEAVSQFNGSSVAGLRRKAMMAYLALCAAATLYGIFSGAWATVGIGVGLAVLTTLCYFVLTGITQKTYLFARARQFVLGASIGDWLMGVIGVLILLALLFFFGWLWWWIGVAVIAAAIAVGFHSTIDRKVSIERSFPVNQMQEMLKSMRLKGLDEDALRQFVCKYAGENWEPLFEALFNYEGKLNARERWGKGNHGRLRKKFRAWRDPLIEWMDARQEQRKARKEQKHLAKLERKALQAKGASDADAKKQADRAAETMVHKAAAIRAVELDDATIATSDAPPPKPAATGQTFNQMLMEDAEDRAERKDAERGDAVSAPRGIINFFIGARARFIVGALLIAGCMLWMHQNGLMSGKEMTAQVKTAEDAKAVAAGYWQRLSGEGTAALNFPLLPDSIRQWFNSITAGIAGLVLVIFAPFRGVKMSLFMIPAAAVILLGERLGLPKVGPIAADYTALAAGGVLLVLALLFGRRRKA